MEEIEKNKTDTGNIEELIDGLKNRQILLKPNTYKPRRAGKRYKGRRRVGVEEARAKKLAWRRQHYKGLQRTLEGSWYSMKKYYRWENSRRVAKGGKPLEFNLSLEEWKLLWQEAGMVWEGGIEIWVFRLRGRGPNKARLMRIDDEKPFTLDNCVVVWKGIVLANGRKCGHKIYKE